MTGRTWMALVGVALVAFILSACGKNQKHRKASEEFASTTLSCQRYQQILTSGYEFHLENGQWVIYAYNGDRYQLTYTEARAGNISDPCTYQNSNDEAWRSRNRNRPHRISNSDSRYQRWLRDHSN